MKSRGLVVGIALIFAVVAAAAVIAYTNGVKHNAVGAGVAADVVVSNKDIPTNSNLNNLLAAGVFKTIRVPNDAVVEGAITDVNQLQNQTTTQPIFKNEQIPASRLSSGTSAKGGVLGISEGHVAVAIKVDGPQGVNGAITRGAYVAVYASFGSLRFVGGSTPAAQMRALIKQGAATTPAAVNSLPAMTITLIPAAKVLEVVNPAVDPATGKSAGGTVTLTLDLTPVDAENLVFAQSAGAVWTGLLPPGDTTGHPIPGSVFPQNRIVGKSAA